jgi:hypothetical protein
LGGGEAGGRGDPDIVSTLIAIYCSQALFMEEYRWGGFGRGEGVGVEQGRTVTDGWLWRSGVVGGWGSAPVEGIRSLGWGAGRGGGCRAAGRGRADAV